MRKKGGRLGMRNDRKLLRKDLGGAKRVRTADLHNAMGIRKNRQAKVQRLRPSIKYEIPEGFSLIPAIEWINGKPRIFRILCENENGRREKSVTLRRAKKGAA
jgi:hypothetical protein